MYYMIAYWSIQCILSLHIHLADSSDFKLHNSPFLISEYSEWTVWNECPVTCAGGIQYRNRNVTVHTGNMTYVTFEDQSQACNTQACPPGIQSKC